MPYAIGEPVTKEEPPVHSIVFEKPCLDRLYRRYNRRRFVHPDPLSFLYDYPEQEDCEIVGLIAASLAYGRVAQILKSIEKVLERMGRSPAAFIDRSTPRKLRTTFSGFKHRFSTSSELAALLLAVKKVRKEHGTLYHLFYETWHRCDCTMQPALSEFARTLTGGSYNSLIACPEKGSACKRLNLFLRWMARRDRVDPGPWKKIPASGLIIPLDTHMHRISRSLGLTRRSQADMKTAVEITDAFKTLSPGDPVRYDFTLTRFGIRNDLTP